jgi:5-(carboxyamino)imidazole ribonucleotide synthase
MLGEESRRKGLPYDVIALDPAGPAAAVDFLMFESEPADGALDALEKASAILHPPAATLRMIQDKFLQKTFLRSKGLPVADFREFAGPDELLASLRDLGCPAVLTARRGSYAGLTSRLIATADQADAALKAFNGCPLVLERPVEVASELSVIAARGGAGEVRTYCAAENLYQDQLLEMTIVPARIDPTTAQAAEGLAREAIKSLPGAGVFGIEMVVDRRGAIFIKNISPCPNESGHYTIEACRTSQFEQQLRAISGMSLGETTRLYSAVTANLFGATDVKGSYRLEGIDAVLSIPGAFVHLYGKKESAPRRLLGHLTMIDVDDPEFRDALVHRAQHARRMIVQKETKE